MSLYMLISFTSMRCSIGWRLVPLNFYFRLSYLYARLMYYVCTDYLQLMLLQVQLEQSTLACIVQMPNKYNRSECSFVWVLRFVANKILVITLYKFCFDRTDCFKSHQIIYLPLLPINYKLFNKKMLYLFMTEKVSI
jgi:hypothetical protein